MNQKPRELQTPMEQHEDAIKRVFVIENLQAILAVIHHIRPGKSWRVGENEFQTVVKAATEDAYDQVMQGIAQFIAESANIKKEN